MTKLALSPPHHKSMLNQSHGFSLIELAVVLFLLSLVLGGIMTPLSTRIEQADREKTEETLNQIKESLVGYALINGHLPCPDCSSVYSTTGGNCDTGIGAATFAADDGIEDGWSSGAPANTRPFTPQCAQVQGNVPWVTLGVKELDAWDNHFLYRVTDDYADSDDGTACGTPTNGVSFSLCSTAEIDINDELGNAVAVNVPAIVVSLGNDASNDGTSQAENQNDNINFVDRGFSSQEESATDDSFDDMMIWISPTTLIYQMIRAEKLP